MAKATEVGFNISATTKGVKSSVTEVKSLGLAVEASSNRSVSAMRSAERASKRMAHNTGKNYAASALGLNPLTKAFVTLSASIYAVEAAYRGVAMVAKFQETTNAFQTMGKSFDFNAENMVIKLKQLSGGAITAVDAMRAASLGMASGLGIKQLEELTVVARKAARVMGVGMGDAYSRIIRGVSKLEPELLDEIGLTTRLQMLLTDYAKSIGKTVDQISSYEKTQIFTNAVIAEGAKKFGDINVEIQSTAERLEEMKATLTDNVLMISSNFLPLILGTANAIAAMSSQLIIAGGIWGTYKLGMKLLHKEELIGLALGKARKSANAQHQIAYIALIEAQAASAALTDKSSKLTKFNTAVTLENAKAKWEQAAATGAVVRAEEAGIAATAKGGLAKFAGKLGRMMTSPITLAIGTLLLLMDTFGMVGEAFAATFGAGGNTTDQVKALTSELQMAHKVMTDYGVETREALKYLNDFGHAAEFTNGKLSGQIALFKDLDGSLLSIASLQAKMTDGTIIYGAELTDLSPTITASVKKMGTLSTELDKVNAKLKEGAPWWMRATGQSERWTEQLVKLAAKMGKVQKKHQEIINEEVAKTAESKMVVSQTEAFKAATKAQNEFGAASKYTVDQLEKMGKTKQDRLLDQIDNLNGALGLVGTSISKNQAYLAELKLGGGDNEKEITRVTKVIAEQIAVQNASTEAVKRTNIEYANKVRNKSLRDDLVLLRQLASEEKTRAKIILDNSEQMPDAVEGYYAKIVAIAKKTKEAEYDILNVGLATNAISWEDYIRKVKILQSKSRQSSMETEEERTAALKEANAERVRMHGSAWENILADMEESADRADGIGRQLADTFTDVFVEMSSTIQSELGKAFGFVEDQAKTSFDSAMKSAQKSYAGMVAAANEAFGLGNQGQALDSNRALEDIERQRVRDVADLTAGRNAGDIDQAGFDQGLTDINTGVRRAKEDLATDSGRTDEDQQQEYQNSLLEAQQALNEAMLEAEQEFADAKNAIWDDMYSGIKETVFNALSEMAAKKVAGWAWELASQAAFGTAKLATEAAVETGIIGTKIAAAPAKVAADTPGIMSGYAQIPFVGLAMGAAVIAGIVGMLGSASGSVSAASPIATPPTPSAPAFHTGGMVSGLGQEVPITAYKGEGVLNTYNGMKAVGGAKGLDQANATGSLGNNNAPVNLTLQIVTPDGEEKGSVTVDNFEDFLRNRGGKIMRVVSQDGTIIMDKRGVA